MSKEAIILLSGGIDSAACVHLLLSKGYSAQALFLDFGQAAAKEERTSAGAVAGHYGIPLHVFNVDAELSYSKGEITGRNSFLIFAGLLFMGTVSGVIAIGVHAGTPYYDCSEDFILRMKDLVTNCSGGRIRLVAPLLQFSKADILRYCADNQIPIEITYSCEAGGQPSCGKCMSCHDREGLEC